MKIETASVQFKNIFRNIIYRCTNFRISRKVFFQKKEFLEVPSIVMSPHFKECSISVPVKIISVNYKNSLLLHDLGAVGQKQM